MIIHRNIGKRTGSANLTLRKKKKKEKVALILHKNGAMLSQNAALR